MNYLKNIIDGDIEPWVHEMFTRYSRGEFTGPVAEAEVKGKRINLKTSYEYAGVIGYLIASNAEGLFQVDGGIYSKTDFRDDIAGMNLDADDKSKKKYFQLKFKGTEIDVATLKQLFTSIPAADPLLNLKPLEKQPYRMKCGKKPPKPGGEKKTEFIKASLDKGIAGQVLDEIFFGSNAKEFTTAQVENVYEITGFEIPDGAGSALEKRMLAKRVGSMNRNLTVDEETKSEIFDFKI